MKKCENHPKYNGKKRPKYECVECLNLYLLLHKAKPRITPKPTKVQKSKKVYDRKRGYSDD